MAGFDLGRRFVGIALQIPSIREQMDERRRACFLFAVIVCSLLPIDCLGRQSPVIGVSFEGDEDVVKYLLFLSFLISLC